MRLAESRSARIGLSFLSDGPLSRLAGGSLVFDSTALAAYIGTFALLVGAGFGLPIPEELPIVFAGAMVGHAAEPPMPPLTYYAIGYGANPDVPFPANLPWGLLAPSEPFEIRQEKHLYWWIMLPICILGVVISDGVLYGMGRFWGPRMLEKKWMQRMLPDKKRRELEDNFHKYGVAVLLFARFLPAIRSPIFVMAGVMRLPFTRFVMADGLYAIPGVSLLFTLSFWFGDQFRDLVVRIERKIAVAKPILFLVLISSVAAYLLYHFLKHPVATGDPRKEIPLVGEQIAETIEHEKPAEPGVNGEANAKSNVKFEKG